MAVNTWDSVNTQAQGCCLACSARYTAVFVTYVNICMQGPEQYAVYRTVIKHVLSDSERLPSLPAITLKIRQAIGDPYTDAQVLAKLINKDPALSALLVKSASSSLYRRTVAPKTLTEVVALLGFRNVHSLVMVHSVRSLFVLRSPVMKKLFNHTWHRLVLKTSLASFFAREFNYPALDEAQMATLLSEVGSLAVLAALTETGQAPDSETYFKLCRNYSRSLGSVLLNKWNVDKAFIGILKSSGNWNTTEAGGMQLIDLVNLSIYHAARFSNKQADLPPLPSIAAFSKLPEAQRRSVHPGCLSVVIEKKEQVQELVNAFK